MSILILGGTRFLGKEVVNSLNRMALKITVFSRSLNVDSEINHICGDRNNIKDIKSIKGNFDVIIDFISYNALHSKQIIQLFPTSRYILISTAWKNIEPTKYNQIKYDYINNKRLAEKFVIKSRTKNKTNTIIRLPVILGSGDHTNRTNFFRKHNDKKNRKFYLINKDKDIYFCLKKDVANFIIKQTLFKDKHYPLIVYPPSYINIKLTKYIQLHQSLEKENYEVINIDLNKTSDKIFFADQINIIGEDFYYPIDIYGKSFMKIDSKDVLLSFMKDIRVLEPM